MENIVLDFRPLGHLTDEEFFHFCLAQHTLHMERTADQQVIIMPPTGGESGRRTVKAEVKLALWNDHYGLGVVFNSETLFKLPDGAIRMADGSWIAQQRWDALTQQQREGMVPLCPDFLIELRSYSDSLQDQQQKMLEWMANGARLALLLDPYEKKAYTYRPNQLVEQLSGWHYTLSGEAVLPGFQLRLQDIS